MVEPSAVQPHLTKAFALQSFGMVEEAVEVYRKCLSLDLHNEEAAKELRKCTRVVQEKEAGNSK